jgi:predicted transposase/invertase (TIGR01784 family)
MIGKFLNPKNDVAFKKIFGSEKNKDILIHFINDILGFTGSHQIQEVEFLSTIQDPEIASKKQSIVDVLCRDSLGVQYIVEMQVDPLKGFEKRAQYYAAKAYCRQTDRGKGETGRYHNLKQVIFIAIADCVLFPNKKAYKSSHHISDKETNENDLKDFSFTFIELPKFKKKKGDKLDSILEKWCYFFKYADETGEQDLEQISGNDSVIKNAYEALNQFNWSEEELMAYKEEVKRIWDNRAVMETAIEAAEERGVAKGEAKGKAEEKREIAKTMLAKGMDVSVISEITGLSLEEITKLKNSL